MKNMTFRFSYNDLGITVGHIERILGNERDENRQLVLDMIEDAMKDASRICDIKAQYTIREDFSLDHQSAVMLAGGMNFGIGKIILGQIRKAESIAVFTCTAGSAIGNLSRELIAGKDFLKGYILDIAGSEIVEAAADRMQALLSEDVGRDGNRTTNRFSPGYCGWHVSEQHKLFRLFPSNFCGITLNESALMDPIKSISGIIGVGPTVKMKPYTCSFCDAENCIYRKRDEK
ncbi:MAG: vitamin B12 dependent-methionine synthase activation domain-containing protein [Bacteroidales bacterium]